MAYYPATSFVPQFTSDAGVPLSGGTIKAYIAESSTLTPMYIDGDGTSGGNTITLNARGEPQVSGNTVVIWLDSEISYKFVLADASAVNKWTIDNISNPNYGLSNTTDPLLGDYLVGTKRTGTGAVAMRLHYWIETRTYNVKDFVDPAVSTTDWTAAINLAYARIPSTGGVLEFPEGDFAFDTALSFTGSKPFAIRGQGPFATRLRPTFAAGDAITINGPSLFAIGDMTIEPTVARNQDTYLIRPRNLTRCIEGNLYLNNQTGGLIYNDTINFLQMSQIQGDSNNAVNGDTCLKIKACGGTVSNVYMRQGPGTTTVYGRGPTLMITGQTTSLRISNCGFSGGGPRSKFTISGITSTGANFTVTTSATHDFVAGDFVALRDCTPSAYNDVWRVASVTSNTIVVTSTADPGTSSVNGTAESISACALVSNEDGACNESSFDNVLFEALTTRRYGTASLYLDGRRGAAGAKPAIQGWNLTGNHYDFGAMGILLSGTAANAGNAPTVFGVDISGGIFQCPTRDIHLDQVSGVTIDGVEPSAVASVTDGLMASGVGSVSVYIYAGPAAPLSRGITLSGCHLGMPRTWQDTDFASYAKSSAIVLDGAGIQDLQVVGNHLYGIGGLTVRDVNSALATTARWKFSKNVVLNGAPPITNAMVIPSVASATTVSLTTYNEIIKITGTTDIQFLNGSMSRVGQELTLIFTGALNLLTTGNFAVTSNYAVAVGTAVHLYYDGTSWYVR